MNLLQVKTFNWNDILFGSEDFGFLLEIILRTVIMFTIILAALRVLGKRGVKQLSVFELVVIIGLGSAAGDPMFYKDVGVLPALTVFIIIIGLYSLTTFLIGKSKFFEILIEGRPVCLIKDGKFVIENFKKESLGEDEFFSELRILGISHLGQVEEAIIETSGSISIFYFEDADVKYGLPIMIDSLKNKTEKIREEDFYSCIFCGNTQKLMTATQATCTLCNNKEWIKSSCKRRVI